MVWNLGRYQNKRPELKYAVFQAFTISSLDLIRLDVFEIEQKYHYASSLSILKTSYKMRRS